MSGASGQPAIDDLPVVREGKRGEVVRGEPGGEVKVIGGGEDAGARERLSAQRSRIPRISEPLSVISTFEIIGCGDAQAVDEGMPGSGCIGRSVHARQIPL